MIHYYHAVWHKRSHLVAPLTDLVGETGQTKVTKANGTKKEVWYWNSAHQEAFDNVKQILACKVLLAYPQYGELFEIYTDASSQQLGAVITQNGTPLAFFSQNLTVLNRNIH